MNETEILKNTQENIKPKRNLSDTWSNWKETENHIPYIDESPKTFIFIAYASFLIILLALSFFAYLIYPRLSEFHIYIALSVSFVIAGIFLVSFIWFTLFIFGVLIKRNIFIFPKLARNLGTGFLPIVMWVAGKFRINKDRITNSFIKVNNILTELTEIQKFKGKVIILTPRCLSVEYKKKLVSIGKSKGLKTFICMGGNVARQRIKKERPDAVFAIACERDLLSGINDVQEFLPVYGISNKRPFGPCLETSFDEEELINTIDKFILDKK